jgi:hypothetical protein
MNTKRVETATTCDVYTVVRAQVGAAGVVVAPAVAVQVAGIHSKANV